MTTIKRTFTVYELSALVNVDGEEVKRSMTFSRQAQADKFKEQLEHFGVQAEVAPEKRSVSL